MSYDNKQRKENLIKQGKRRCQRCKKVLDLNADNFYRSKGKRNSGFSYYCKECSRIEKRKYYQKNREKEKEYTREYYRKNKARCKEWRKEYMKTVRGRYFVYKADATRKRRNISWNLTIDEFEEITKQPCHYCGRMGKYGFSGIDRKDSSKGYSIENCVPCCEVCNRVKWILNHDEFIDLCKKIAKRF